MPRSKTPRKSSKSKAGAAPYDLSDPNVKLALTLTSVFAVSVLWNNGMNTGDIANDLKDGDLWKSVTDNDKALHGNFWPFSLMWTFHVINTVQGGAGGFWASDIVNACFNAFGGLLLSDVMTNGIGFPASLGGNILGGLVVCWYIVNHNIPFTEFNLWSTISGHVSKFLPLQAFMDLCTLSFNVNLLLSTARAEAQATGDFWGDFAVYGQAIFACVAVHCAGDFFSTSGFRFDVDGCSTACERAAIVAFWFASNGLSALPFVGEHLGKITGQAEDFFDGRADFLLQMILIWHVVGDRIPFQPHTKVIEALYTVTGV